MGFKYNQLGGGVIVGPTGATGPTGPAGSGSSVGTVTSFFVDGGNASSDDDVPLHIDLSGGALADAPRGHVNIEVGAIYNVALSDTVDTIVAMSSPDNNIVVLPSHDSVQVPVASRVPIVQLGAGKTSIVGEDDTVTVLSPGNASVGHRYGTVYATKIDLGTWLLSGDLEQL